MWLLFSRGWILYSLLIRGPVSFWLREVQVDGRLNWQSFVFPWRSCFWLEQKHFPQAFVEGEDRRESKEQKCGVEGDPSCVSSVRSLEFPLSFFHHSIHPLAPPPFHFLLVSSFHRPPKSIFFKCLHSRPGLYFIYLFIFFHSQLQ